MTASTILSLLSALFGLARLLVTWAEQRRWMEAGAAQAVLKGIQEADDAITQAQKARQAVRDGVAADPAELRRDDGFRRD